MLFNSIEFLIFFPLVFCVFWFFLKNKIKSQNIFLLLSSYIFYGFWDLRFLFLIILSTIVDFNIGLSLSQKKNKSIRKSLLLISIFINLSILGFFKYYNFFIESISDLLLLFNYSTTHNLYLNLILPVGISFYTFQTLSYTIDIYRNKIKPTNDYISFALFVSFFPQLVAGPIERASRLLPQIISLKKFNYTQSVDGLRLTLWGFFKKVVIADSLAPIVNDIFLNYSSISGSMLFIGAFLFSFQIYCDFSGYSDIAIGISKVFGIELNSNFKFPYFSRNIGEFWTRWHISLSSWFKDYLYIPLGGSKKNKRITLLNIFIVFLISGLWHGANFTFLMWGLFHAVLYIPLYISKKNKKYNNIDFAKNGLIRFREIFNCITTFCLVSIGWIFFRSETVEDSFFYISKMFNPNNFFDLDLSIFLVFPSLIFLIIVEFICRKDERKTVFHFIKNKNIRKMTYLFFFYIIYINWLNQSDVNFIYFQF